MDKERNALKPGECFVDSPVENLSTTGEEPVTQRLDPGNAPCQEHSDAHGTEIRTLIGAKLQLNDLVGIIGADGGRMSVVGIELDAAGICYRLRWLDEVRNDPVEHSFRAQEVYLIAKGPRGEA